jgi:hypothetical protein
MDPKDEESFSRKSCMYGWDLICKWIPKMRKASQGSLDLKDDESFSRKSYMYG